LKIFIYTIKKSSKKLIDKKKERKAKDMYFKILLTLYLKLILKNYLKIGNFLLNKFKI